MDRSTAGASSSHQSTASRTVPVLIPFFGPAPRYLEVALRSAAAWNPTVILIGDAANQHAWREHRDSGRLGSAKLDEFLQAYVHMSSHSPSFELACFRRAFVVETWMTAQGLDEAFVLDGDIVTFASYAREVLPSVPAGSVAALLTPMAQDDFDWTTSAHVSYWQREALADFTAFCVAAYRDPSIRRRLEDKYRWHLDGRQPGGVCDMTLLHLWRERHESRVANLARVADGVAVDLAIGTARNYQADEYTMRYGLKRLVFADGVPYAHNRVLHRAVRFLAVHCQGRAKDVMTSLVRPHRRGLYAEAHLLHRLRASVESIRRHVLGSARRTAPVRTGST